MSDLMQIDFSAVREPRIVGIDLGTTNSLVAFMDLTGPEVIPGLAGERLVPSVVSYTEAGQIVVGNPARELLLTQPGRTVYIRDVTRILDTSTPSPYPSSSVSHRPGFVPSAISSPFAKPS